MAPPPPPSLWGLRPLCGCPPSLQRCCHLPVLNSMKAKFLSLFMYTFTTDCPAAAKATATNRHCQHQITKGESQTSSFCSCVCYMQHTCTTCRAPGLNSACSPCRNTHHWHQPHTSQRIDSLSSLPASTVTLCSYGTPYLVLLCCLPPLPVRG
jgi:hypothetical protein